MITSKIKLVLLSLFSLWVISSFWACCVQKDRRKKLFQFHNESIILRDFIPTGMWHPEEHRGSVCRPRDNRDLHKSQHTPALGDVTCPFTIFCTPVCYDSSTSILMLLLLVDLKPAPRNSTAFLFPCKFHFQEFLGLNSLVSARQAQESLNSRSHPPEEVVWILKSCFPFFQLQ